jgi:lauroyl/myristoyl acyltransferase
VLAGLHLGGWEVVAAVPGAVFPVRTSVVVADNWLAWAMQHVRAAEGLHLIYRSAPATAAVRLLRRGEALLILGDDATGQPPRKHRVRFGDSHALLPVGIITLARLSGAAVVPFAVLPDGPRRWRAYLEPPIEAPGRGDRATADAAALQLLADRWSARIRAHPEQWAASFPIAWDEG